MSGGALQYVTLVVQGGTPIRIADQMGAPYPTTGRGALVFAEGPTLNNPTFTGKVITGSGETIGLSPGTVGGPSLFFGNVLNMDGLFSKGIHHVNVTVGGVEVADFGPGLLTVYTNIAYSGALTGGSASFTTFAATSITVENVTGTSASFTGPVTSTGTPVGFIVNGPAATLRTMGAATAGLMRWTWGADTTAESGANAGSNYALRAYNDAGVFLNTPISVVRSTGAVTLIGQLTGPQATISGAGQATAAPSTSTGLGGSLLLRDTGTGLNNGGMLMFGINQGPFAAIKGLGVNGGGNVTGDLIIATRRLTTDATLTEAARFKVDGSTDLIGAVVSGGPAASRWQFNANTLSIWGTGGASNNVLIQHDNTHAYVRPQNAGSRLYLGSAGINEMYVTANNLSPNVTKTKSLGTAALVWLGLHTDSITYYGSTSGSTTIRAPAIAGTSTITWPAASGTVALAGDAATVASGISPPVGPAANTLWWNSNSATGGGQLYIYYNDGNTSQWVVAAPSASGITASILLAAGSVVDFGGDVPPTGWLLCNGQSLLIADYTDLFAAIGYKFGGSDAYFYLPFIAPTLTSKIIKV